MLWNLSYIGGFLILGLMVIYFFKGLINLIKLKKVTVIVSSFLMGTLGVLGFLKKNKFPESEFFWIFSLSLLLMINTLLIGLHYSKKKESKGFFKNESKLSSDFLLLILAISLFSIGFFMKEMDFISIILFIGFMYAFLIGSYRIISKLKK